MIKSKKGEILIPSGNPIPLEGSSFKCWLFGHSFKKLKGIMIFCKRCGAIKK